MSGHDDDLSPWNDDPLVRALRGPGTADELGGPGRVHGRLPGRPAHGTDADQRRSPARAGRRLGGGGTAVVVVLALGAGAAAAAAYTQNLPDPVQRAVHGVLGPVGVPAPKTSREDASREPASPAPEHVRPAARRAIRRPRRPVSRPATHRPVAPTKAPSESAHRDPVGDSPTETPTESPSPTPTETPAAAVPVGRQPRRHRPPGRAGRAGPADGSGVRGGHLARPFPGGLAAAARGRVVDRRRLVPPATPPVPSASPRPPSCVRPSSGSRSASLTSAPWRVVLVPTLDAVSRPAGRVDRDRGRRQAARQPGDAVELLRPAAG